MGAWDVAAGTGFVAQLRWLHDARLVWVCWLHSVSYTNVDLKSLLPSAKWHENISTVLHRCAAYDLHTIAT